jgi:hypothetical protein
VKLIRQLPVCIALLTAPAAYAQNVQGDVVAQGFSESLGISLEEAQRRLELLAEANDVAKKLEAGIGDRFGGLRITNSSTTGYPVNSPFRDDGSGVTFTHVKQVIDASTDAEFRVPASGTHALRNEIKYGSTGASVMAVTAKYDPRNWTPPSFAFCKQGRTTRYLCGTIDSNSVSFTGNGIQQYFLRGVSSTPGAGIVAPGDSGGPVFVSNGAVGLTVGAGGTKLGTCPNNTYTWVFIQPIAVVETALGVSVATTVP